MAVETAAKTLVVYSKLLLVALLGGINPGGAGNAWWQPTQTNHGNAALTLTCNEQYVQYDFGR